MVSDAVKQYSKTLNNLGIENEIVQHPDLKIPSEVQEHLGLTLADGLSTMIMKTGDRFIAVIRRCDTRFDSKKLKALVGNKLRIASPEEFKQITSVPLGAAKVLNTEIVTYLDEKLFEKNYLTSGSGSFTCSMRVRAEDLKKLPNSSVVSISE